MNIRQRCCLYGLSISGFFCEINSKHNKTQKFNELSKIKVGILWILMVKICEKFCYNGFGEDFPVRIWVYAV